MAKKDPRYDVLKQWYSLNDRRMVGKATCVGSYDVRNDAREVASQKTEKSRFTTVGYYTYYVVRAVPGGIPRK